MRWVDTTSLLLERGMTGATGNLYVGLHEYPEMGFLLHYLRADDLFVDIGANVGSYTILASGSCGARTISFEPSPVAHAALLRNVERNGLRNLITTHMQAVGREEGVLRMTRDQDTVNHITTETNGASPSIETPVVSLTSAVGGQHPALMKIDVEGFETAVLEGAEAMFREPSLGALIIELNGCGSRYGYSDAALHQRLIDSGLNPVTYDPMARTLLPAAVKSFQGNVIYVRDFAAAASRLAAAPRKTLHVVAAEL